MRGRERPLPGSGQRVWRIWIAPAEFGPSHHAARAKTDILAASSDFTYGWTTDFHRGPVKNRISGERVAVAKAPRTTPVACSTGERRGCLGSCRTVGIYEMTSSLRSDIAAKVFGTGTFG